MKIIQSVELECTTGSSNKFYHVQIVIDVDNLVSMRSIYGPIGKSGQAGVGGSFKFNAKEAINLRTIDSHMSLLADEANKLLASKTKKGYQPVGKMSVIDNFIATRALRGMFPDDDKAAKQQPKEPVAGAFDVEIIGISMGAIRVAKVLDDSNYDVLGVASNPKQRSVKTGDVVSVISKNDQLELV